MTQNQILQRLSRLERKVVDLQKRLNSAGEKKVSKTWRDYIGMFKDDPDFQKAVEYGARWRESYRPKSPRRTKKK
jgi:hypothetical protein